jgi:outer membrane protein assembly factor BamB
MVIVPVSRRQVRYANHRPGTNIVVNENAEGRTLVAFDQESGDVVWKAQDYGIDHSSPILINFDGQDQLVLLAPEVFFAVDPANGGLLWQHAFDRVCGYLITPVFSHDDCLFFSTPDTGSQLMRLTKSNGETLIQRQWQSNKLKIAFANPVQIGDLVVGSSGHNPTILTCLNIRTGKIAWKDRSVGLATFLRAGDRLIILEAEGNLALATATPEGLTVHSKCKITEPDSYAAPTLVGKTLYVRDRKHIMAFDLG